MRWGTGSDGDMSTQERSEPSKISSRAELGPKNFMGIMQGISGYRDQRTRFTS